MYAISPRRAELEFVAADRFQRYPLVHRQVSAILPGYAYLKTRAGVSYFSDNPGCELISSNIGIAQSRGEGGIDTGPSHGQFRCAREDGVPRDFRGERPEFGRAEFGVLYLTRGHSEQRVPIDLSAEGLNCTGHGVVHLNCQPLQCPIGKRLIRHDHRDRRIGRRSRMLPCISVAKLRLRERREMRGEGLSDGTALACDRMRTAQHPTVSIHNRSERVHHGNNQNLDVPHLTKGGALAGVLSVAEVAALHRETARAARAHRKPAAARGIQSGASEPFIRRDGVESSPAQVEDNCAGDHCNVAPVAGRDHLLLESIRNRGRHFEAVGRTTRQRDRVDERLVIREPQCVCIYRAGCAAAHIHCGHDRLAEEQHSRPGWTFFILGNANLYCREIKTQRPALDSCSRHGWRLGGSRLRVGCCEGYKQNGNDTYPYAH